ncbi:MAG: hypothetical protein CVU57_23585 [Deltaproteobacteria bacterium HGW-Deltaproteobacteria-15]|jgi:hypothetical protein|nr:MAG: hypothetical protein CVU57_23585 [Deltaproteobacteria bacterium HGW-Deltaproteobacteria-15]
MTNSDRSPREEAILDTVFELLQEENLSRFIDEPIDDAFQAFQIETAEPLSHLNFNTIISRFFYELNAKAICPRRHLSETESLAEAVFLLEKYYKGVHTRGYDGAWMDASSSEGEGIGQVLFQLANTMKQIERDKYIKWVLLSNIDQHDWKMKVRLVSKYLQRYGEDLPPQLAGMDPFQLIESLPGLIDTVLSADFIFSNPYRHSMIPFPQ